MPLQTECPGCGTSYRLADSLLGKSVACKTCGNPFAVQPGIGEVCNPSPAPALWRYGDLLVFHREASFPDVCLKSNQPTTHHLKYHVPLSTSESRQATKSEIVFSLFQLVAGTAMKVTPTTPFQMSPHIRLQLKPLRPIGCKRRRDCAQCSEFCHRAGGDSGSPAFSSWTN
jgi:predicted Zn finger-like uncharacterized protein